MRPADAVLLGAGGAGTAVLHQLALALDRRGPGARRPQPLRVVVVDPLDRLATRPADRTWCSWVERGGQPEADLAPAVHRSWQQVHVVGADGTDHALDLGPLRYAMVRGEDYYAHVASLVDDVRRRGLLELEHLPVAVDAVEEDAGGVTAATPAGPVRAALAVDSRPAAPRRPADSSLVQHFLGERVRTCGGRVDPARAVLMDFTVPQPPVGLAFGYCLPSDAATALVEHTAFVPAPLGAAEQAGALRAYRASALGGPEGEVEHTETGAIPMSDAAYARRASPPPGVRCSRVVRVGTAGGAVRPSTGYAFSAVQRTARALAAQLAAGVPAERVRVPAPYPRRHAWMDALVLRALVTGPAAGGLDGPAFFVRLFERNPPERVLRFLDGLTGPAQELALMATAPRGVMLRAAAGHGLRTATRTARTGRAGRAGRTASRAAGQR